MEQMSFITPYPWLIQTVSHNQTNISAIKYMLSSVKWDKDYNWLCNSSMLLSSFKLNCSPVKIPFPQSSASSGHIL